MIKKPDIDLFDLLVVLGIPLVFGGVAWLVIERSLIVFLFGFFIGGLGLASVIFEGNRYFRILGMVIGVSIGAYLAHSYQFEITKYCLTVSVGGIVGYVLTRWGAQIADGFWTGI